MSLSQLRSFIVIKGVVRISQLCIEIRFGGEKFFRHSFSLFRFVSFTTTEHINLPVPFSLTRFQLLPSFRSVFSFVKKYQYSHKR